MKIFLVLLAAGQMASVSAWAQDETFRLDVPGGTMEHVTPLNQEDIGSCAYLATSYLIDAWRFSHGDKDYKFRTSETKLLIDAWVMGGSSEIRKLPKEFALQRSKPHWMLSDFAKEKRYELRHENDHTVAAQDITLWAYRENGSFSRAEENEFLGDWTDEFQDKAVTRGLRLASLFHNAQTFNNIENYEVLKQLSKAGATLGVLVDTPEANPSILKVESGHFLFGVEVAPLNVFAQLQWIYLVNVARKSPMAFESLGRIYADISGYFAFFKKHFESRNAAAIQPVRIGYCAHILKNPGYRGVAVEKESDGDGIRTVLQDDCGPHAGVVMGQRVIDGNLEYLLQDTNGPEGRAVWDTDKGRYWIGAEELMTNTFFLNYFALKANSI